MQILRIVVCLASPLPQVQAALPRLLAALPRLHVVTVNLHPEHKAVIEGDTEIPLTDLTELAMPIAGVQLHLGPRSFFQTNTAVAAGLYRQAQAWIDAARPTTVADLYCGVGGFALHAVAAGRQVTGVEVSPEAIKAAQRSAAQLLAVHPDSGPVTFVVGDATAYAIGHPAPDLVVVNPPRRGLDEALTDWLEAGGVRDVVYSSCNITTLARDLARMPSLLPHQARLFDMFPQTDHHEVMVWLRRGPVAHA